MANNKKSKAEMKKVYMRRRIIALIVLLLIILLIISRCTKPKTTTTTTTSKQTVETTQNQPVQMEKVPSNEVNVTPREASPQTNETNQTTDNNNNNNTTNTTSTTEMTESEKALSAMENELNRYYGEVADVEYKDYNNAFFFDLKGDAKNLYLKKDTSENDEKAFKSFWEDFKKDLIKSSQEITENIEPRIELHVVSPVDNKSTAVMIKDGEEIFDITER